MDLEKIKNKIYDLDLYNDLMWKKMHKEPTTKEEDNYINFCYHYEEAQSGLL